MNKTIIYSYGKYLATSFATPILVELAKNHKVTSNDIKWDAIAIAVAIIPVIRNYFNKKYPAYGKVIDAVASKVQSELPATPQA